MDFLKRADDLIEWAIQADDPQRATAFATIATALILRYMVEEEMNPIEFEPDDDMLDDGGE